MSREIGWVAPTANLLRRMESRRKNEKKPSRFREGLKGSDETEFRKGPEETTRKKGTEMALPGAETSGFG